MTAYVFRISLDCPHCRAGVPVNGFTEEVLCNNCLRSIPLDVAWWETHLDPETIEEALTFEPGQGSSSQHLGGMNEKIEYGNRPPRCQNCKTDFDAALLQAAVATQGFACRGCEQRIRVRKATSLALSLIHEADLLVHEDETGTGLQQDGVSSMEPVLFACLSCGAGLRVDGSTRTPKCSHCGTPNYLPDPLWLRLHPAVVSHAFFVTRDLAAKPPKVSADMLQDNLDSDRAVRILKDLDIEVAVLERIHEIHEDEDEVLEALARHPKTPDALLRKLADPDHGYEVREAVAKRPHLPADIIETLARDHDSDVRNAMLQRPGIFKQPAAVLEDLLRDADLDDLGRAIQDMDFPEWKLYGLADNCTPDEARRILKAPNASLRVLRRLGSNPESRPFIKEHSLYQEMGWFKKLFFFGGS